MRIYKNKYTDKKITEDSYNDLYDFEKYQYDYIGSTNGDKKHDDLLLSGILGYVTNSGIVGGLLGGSLLGGILGDFLNDKDDNPFF